MSSNNSSPRYRLVAQNPRGQIVLEVVESGHYLIRAAAEIVKNNDLIQGLPLNQVVIISFIAGMES